MAKLTFNSLKNTQFTSFKLIPKKKTIGLNKKLTKNLVKGICIKDGNNFKIKIDVSNLKPDIIAENQPDVLIIDFTEESYDLKGKISVWDKKIDEYGKYCRYIRDDNHAKFMPGSPEKYVPFCNNWICDGYIVKRDGKIMFDFNECLYPKGYNNIIHEDE